MLREVVATGVLLGLVAGLSYYDIRRYILPDALTLAMAVCGLALSAVTSEPPFVEALLGAALAGFLLLLLRLGFHRATGRDGLGRGDIKLAAACGSWVGVWDVGTMLFIAASLGLMATIILSKLRSDRIAFGPFLGGATVLVWSYGRWID